ncbi:MAG TPA: CHAT domain-containing protein [Pyrinomonadaceae bacterium]|jgi:hypothetical protein
MDISEQTPYEVLDEIEVRVFQGSTGEFKATILLPDGESATCSLPSPPHEILIETTDPHAYGVMLFEWLFREEIGKAFRGAQKFAEMSSYSQDFGGNMRLRLWLDPRSTRLHTLWWEALRDPAGARPVSTTMAFSRFMRVETGRARPVAERPLHMLLVASNPTGMSQFDLADINVHLEKTILGQATSPLQDQLQVVNMLRPTLRAVYEAQSQNGYHLIHLLAHALPHPSEAGGIVMADEQGQGQVVPGGAVVEALTGGMKRPPHLAFLATPVTGEEQAGQTLVKLAPQLVDAGVQAAVAIQAGISEGRLREFCTRFYESLVRTGIIDVAMATARSAIYETDNWEWAFPVLYTSTPDARLFQILPKHVRALAAFSF